ncbi:MAG: hypothetical protein ACJAQ4_002347 [Cryomorphaceae bacterium]|jgi:hypothetical protein
MTKLLNLAIAALICASTIATAQTRNSDINSEVAELSNYLTNDEKMSAMEQDILTLTNELLNEKDSEEQLAIRTRINSKQKSLIKLKREKEELAEMKAENRTIEIFKGDLTKSDLPLKSFKTKYDDVTNQLTISIRTQNSNDATIRVLTPGKEILQQETSAGANGRHTMVVDLTNNQLHTLCVNIEEKGKLITKVISL